jgi:transposase-like protein
MTSIRELEKIDFEDFEKPRGRELVIIPKPAFIDWYKRTKNIVMDIEMEKTEKEYQECPNCRSAMESYDIKSAIDDEPWYLCPKCNLTFSEKQHDYFTMLILRSIKR